MARKLPLLRGWKRRVKSSIVHILALSHYSFTALLAQTSRRSRRIKDASVSVPTCRGCWAFSLAAYVLPWPLQNRSFTKPSWSGEPTR